MYGCVLKLRFLLLYIVLFFSCSSESERTTGSRNGFVQRDTVVRFIPKDYEITRDTIKVAGSENLHVIIQKEVLMHDYVSQVYLMDSNRTVVDNYRDYSSTIILFVKNRVVCNKSFTKKDFPQIGDTRFYNKAITLDTKFKSYNPETNTLVFSHTISVPDTDWTYEFEIFLSTDCSVRTELIEIE